MKSVYTDDRGDIDRVKSILEDSKYYDLDEKLPQIEIDVLREASIIQTQKRIFDSLTLDKHLIQAIHALDDAHSSLNLISERICTWYAHTNGEARVPIETILSKDSLTFPIVNLKETYIQVQELVASLSSYIDDEAPKIFPSMAELLDSQLAVRLVSFAAVSYTHLTLPTTEAV